MKLKFLSFLLVGLSAFSCVTSTGKEEKKVDNEDFINNSNSDSSTTSKSDSTSPTNPSSDSGEPTNPSTDPEPEVPPVVEPKINPLYDYDKINSDFLQHNIVNRFLAFSDNHIASSDTDIRNKRMINTIQQVSAMVQNSSLNDNYNKLDAILDVGDLISDGTSLSSIKNCLNAGKRIYNNYKPSNTQLVITTGNHEYEKNVSFSDSDFYTIFNQYPTADVKIGGYHFITIKCDGTTTRTDIRTDGWTKGWDYTDAEVAKASALIQEAYNDTGADKPIFVAMHIGNLNTVIGTDSYVHNSDLTATEKFYDIFKKYSNLVVFSGHSHFNTVDDCSIHQKDFTSLNTGCNTYTMRSYNGYFENKSDGTPNPLKTNRVMMYNYFHDNYNQITSTLDDNTKTNDVTGIKEFEDRNYVTGGLIVEVNSINQVRIRPWNTINKGFTRKSWVIDSFDKTKFKYTPERFKAKDFFFDEGAEIIVDKCINNTVNIKVPKIGPNSIEGRVYKVKLFDENNSCIFQRNISTDYYNERFEYPLSFYFKNMVANKQYTVTAQAFNSLYASNLIDPGTLSSNILSKTFTYNNDTSTNALDADIIDFDIDVENQKLIRTNKYGLDPYVIGKPKIYYDSQIKKNVLETTGDESGFACLENYFYLKDKFNSQFTFEAYFKLNEATTSALFSSQQSSTGFGLEYYGGSLRFSLGNNSTMTRNTISGFSANAWHHIVVTYNSTTGYQRAYLNGVYKSQTSQSRFQQTAAGVNTQLYIGADVTNQNNTRLFAESFSKISVAKLRMYSSVLSDSNISTLYNNLTK